MEFAAFADRAERLAAESADIETTLATAALLGDVGPTAGAVSTDNPAAVTAADNLATVTRFLLGRIFPAHDTRTLDVGPALCHEAIARAAGPNVTAADVESRLADAGEIGAVAAAYDFGGQRGLGSFGSAPDEADDTTGGGHGLTVADVDETLREIAAMAGDGSDARKLDALFGLFNRCDPAEAKLLARLVLGEMRLGVGEGTVRDAIAEAFLAAGTPEPGGEASVLRSSDEAVSAVERALQVTNDYGYVAVLARDSGVTGLRTEQLVVGRPVQAMLAQAGTATDALDAFETVAVEPKFDGARVQAHYVPASHDGPTEDNSSDSGLGPTLYSRNMDDVTDSLPEIVEYLASHVSVRTIFDGEVVAIDDNGDPLPFQAVLRRFRRKHNIDQMRDTITLRFHAFDCLHADGDDLLDTPLRERHDRLTAVLPDAAVDRTLVDESAAIESIETAALEAGHEGVMLKDPDSAYTPGDRGQTWLKRKPDVETLDAVVIGAEWGEGRRAELFGTFLLGVRAAGLRDDGAAASSDPDEFVAIGKVATGLTDAALADLTSRLQPHIVSETGTELRFRPQLVIEVGYEEIQPSPTYESGYALRFPRFIGIRADKAPAAADSVARVRRLAGDD